MCEWLSGAEWCDVRLVCRGRAFSAHRAVLASASDFLRHVFLSCPEEAPTLVLLPDFDLEAMFSLLFYVYNGEVVLPRAKLPGFLEVISTLKIFVDEQTLDLMRGSFSELEHIVEDVRWKGHCEAGAYTDAMKQGVNEFVVIKKVSPNLIEMKRSPVCGYGADTHCNQTAHGPCLDKTQPDRQKRSYLRDSFIGSYPQNGNVNGHEPSVPAMLNERYRDTTSVLPLTNANASEPKLTHCASSRNEAFEYSAHAHPNNYRDIHFSNDDSRTTYNADGSRTPKPFDKQNSSHDTPWPETAYQEMNYRLPHNNLSVRDCSDKNSHGDNFNYETRSKNGNLKQYISNQVTDCPWKPRQPITYRPHQSKQLKQDTGNCSNDANNNFSQIAPEEATLPVNVSDNTSTTEMLTPTLGLKCELCSQRFQTEVALSAHAKSHTARYSCPECLKTFSQLRNYKYHMSIHRGTKEFAATCSVCGKYFNDRGYLSSHMKIHRNRKEYKCQDCPKSFNQRVAYNMHVRIHTGVKPHQCAQCGKAFSRKMLLKQHLRTHSGERPYACPHCARRFADRSNMTLHLRLHTGVKPFTCDYCQKSFTKKHHLKSHLNYHTGVKPYACPRCKLGFTQSSNMRTHLKKCTVELNPPVADT